MDQPRRGYVFGIAAYVIWGFFPPYYKLLSQAGPVEILAHRVVWSMVFVAGILLVGRRGRAIAQIRRLPARILLGIAAAATLIGLNWGMYIYAVVSSQIVESSLGYFINPLFVVLLGVVVLGERLRRAQWTAIGVGALAVAVLTVDYGRVPWIALTLTGSFGTYTLIKKRLALPAAEGLFVESAVLAPLALVYLGYLGQREVSAFTTISPSYTMLLMLAGPVTAIPLLCFANAANAIPMSALGVLQYITPSLQFGFGVLVFQEPLPLARLAGFALVWGALAIFTIDGFRHASGMTSRRGLVDDLGKHPGGGREPISNHLG
ncbi:MAG: EamA family transporter RarD [Dactylosporangium sp.]|nr:EamA family transporter RarD [Dactylosporangium sp.]NNJ60086.1 EamA family transporter RarD [Dactylosporangium sp.]